MLGKEKEMMHMIYMKISLDNLIFSSLLWESAGNYKSAKKNILRKW